MEPLCIDLFCGLGGWAEGFLAEGYRVVGFDIERHNYGRGGYPGQLVLQDALTLHGSQFRGAACIVASPPCQEFSYLAMPWSRAKQIGKALRLECDARGKIIHFPKGYTGSRTVKQMTALFDACFRIQREACEAAGRYIPMVVENVKGAQPWVGPAKAHFGSFYLWGDVAMVGNRVVSSVPVFGRWTRPMKSGRKFNPDGTEHPQGSWFKIADSKERGARSAVKVAGLNWSGSDKPGYVARAFNDTAVARGVKGNGGGWYGDYAEQKASGRGASSRQTSSHSKARKAASAEIAKIPFELASYVARSYNTSTVN